MLTHIISGLTALGVAAGTALAAPMLAGDDNRAASDLSVVSVTYTDLGGGYSPYLLAGCDGLTVTVNDSTPSELFDYAINIEGQELPVLDAQPKDDGTVSMLTVCPADLAPNYNYDLTVSEAGEAGETYTWTLEQVQGPLSSAPSGRIVAGQKGRVALTEGTWELGTKVETKVVASRGATREQAMAHADSELTVPSTYNATTRTVEFTVPVAATGRYLWVSAKGTRPAMASYGVFAEPLKVGAPAKPSAFPKKWVKSPGKKKGVAKVKRTVRVTKPVYSTPSVAKLVKVKYQWKANGKAIKGAKKASYKIPRARAGKRIAVTITFTAKGYKAFSKTVAFGKARR